MCKVISGAWDQGCSFFFLCNFLSFLSSVAGDLVLRR